jgi:bifunctional lysine-specific demethylase and histidyl-hydroxylase NO66
MSSLDAGRSMDLDRPVPAALQRCIAVDVDTFAREHWGATALLSRAERLPGPFTDLLDLDAVDEIVSRRGLRTPFIRIARDGEVVGSKQFTGPGGVGAEIADQVRDDDVMRLFAGGATIVLQGLHRLWPPVTDFVRQLSADLGHPCQANAYITPASSRGFSAHYDVHDVFVLQLAGSKHWHVHAPVHSDPLRDQPWNDHAPAVAERAANEPPVIDTVLRPGDAMYLPRGFVHSATALGQVSAHLTIGVHVITRFALVEALFGLLHRERELRRSLPLGIDVANPAQLAPHLDAVLDLVGEAIGRIAPQDVAQAVREKAWKGSRPEPLPPLAHAEFTASVGVGDLVRRRSGLHFRLHAYDGAGEPTLELPGRTLRFEPGTGPALRALLSGDVLAVGQLPGLDENAQLDLVRRLLGAAVLVPGGLHR